MWIISSREGFKNSDQLADADEVRNVNLSDDRRHKPETEASLAKFVQGKNVLLLVHGYNNKHGAVMRAYRKMREQARVHLRGQYDAVIGYSWPGGDRFYEYHQARRRAGAVAKKLKRWLGVMESKADSLDVIAHSMGCRVVLSVLKTGNRPRLRNLFTMAAAVDNESLEPGEEFNSSTANCKKLYVFHSENDPVVSGAYVWAELDHGLGAGGPEDPNVIKARVKNVWVVDCRNVIDAHGGYKSNGWVFEYIGKELTATQATNRFVTLAPERELEFTDDP